MAHMQEKVVRTIIDRELGHHEGGGVRHAVHTRRRVQNFDVLMGNQENTSNGQRGKPRRQSEEKPGTTYGVGTGYLDPVAYQE